MKKVRNITLFILCTIVTALITCALSFCFCTGNFTIISSLLGFVLGMLIAICTSYKVTEEKCSALIDMFTLVLIIASAYYFGFKSIRGLDSEFMYYQIETLGKVPSNTEFPAIAKYYILYGEYSVEAVLSCVCWLFLCASTYIPVYGLIELKYKMINRG